MNNGKTLYFTDGNSVVVTNSSLQVKNAVYPLANIYSHKVSVVSPKRVSSTIFMGIGILVFICGAMNLLPSTLTGSTSILGFTIIKNALIMVTGIAILLCAMVIMFLLKEKYVVSLSTSRGEKQIIVSRKREYVNEIIDALNHACLDLIKKSRANKAKW